MTEPLSPYRGLSPFGDSDLDARLFFGRERETRIVVANLQAARLTVLYGASGVGKTSLLRAGVAHGMRGSTPSDPRHVIAVVGEWRGADPLGGVAAALDEAAASALARPIELPEGLSLADRLEALTAVIDGEVYLVLDQLEEYLLYHGGDRGGPLGDALSEIVRRSDLRVGVLVGIRDDALAQLDVLKARVPGLFGNLLRLDHLTRPGGREAIVGPLGVLRALDLAVAEAEPALVEAVLDQVAAGQIAVPEGRGVIDGGLSDGRIEAPFLQLVMERLWQVERGRGSTVLRSGTLVELGGAEQIVEEHLDGALATLRPEQQALAAVSFGLLVTPSGTKIAHSSDDLSRYAAVPSSELRPVLEQLAAERILRPVADERGGEPRFEIYHDVLAAAVLEWSGRYESDRELERARDDARRRHRRLAAVTAVALAGFAVVSALAVWAFVERGHAKQQALQARAHALGARAVNLLPTDPRVALVLAAEAARLSPSESAEDVLRQALLADHLTEVVRVGGPVVDVEFESPDRLLAASMDGVAHAYRLHPARVVLSSRHRRPVVQVLSDGGRMESASLDGTVRIASALPSSAQGQRTVVLRHPGPVVAMATGVACRGTPGCLVTASGRTLRMWSVDTGSLTGELQLDATVRELVMLASGRIAVRALDRVIRVVDPVQGRVTARWATGIRRIDSIAAHPERELLALGLENGDVLLGNPSSGEAPTRYPTHGRSVLDLDLRGDLLLTGSANGEAIVRDLATGRATQLPGSHANHVRSVELSLDGRSALTASSDGTAKVWEIPGGRLVALLAGHDDAVRDAVFSDDAQTVMTGSIDGTVRVWESGTRPELEPASGRAPDPPATTAEAGSGATATAAGNDVRLRTAAGSTVVLAGHRDRVNSVAFDETGRFVVTASRDHEARIWNADTGALVQRLAGMHSGSVADARFSPDGRWVVTAGPISAGLWNARTGEFVAFLRGPQSRLVAAAFTPDSRTVRTVERGGVVRGYLCGWCGDLDELLAIADERMRLGGQTLTPAERARYLD